MSTEPVGQNTGVKALTPLQLEYFARYLFAQDHHLSCRCLDDLDTGTPHKDHHGTSSPRVIAEWTLWWNELSHDGREFWRQRAKHTAFIIIMLHKDMLACPIFDRMGQQVHPHFTVSEYELAILTSESDNDD